MTNKKCFRWRKQRGVEYFDNDREVNHRMYVKTLAGWKPILALEERATLTGFDLIITYWISSIAFNTLIPEYTHLGSSGLKKDATLKEAKAFVENWIIKNCWNDVSTFMNKFDR